MTATATAPARLLAPPLTRGGNPLGVLSCALWCVYFLATPFYVLPSGLPQPADLVIVLLLGLAAVSGGLLIPRHASPVVAAHGLLVMYAVAVGGVHALISRDDRMLMPGAYYLFNFCACLLFVVQLQRGAMHGHRWLALAIVTSLTIQVVLAALTSGSGMRATNFFNNPNQLGFYAVLYGSLFWVLSTCVSFPPAASIALHLWAYGAVAYLSACSLSRSAVVAAGLLILLAILCSKRARVLFVVGAGAVAVPYLLAAGLGSVGNTKEVLHKDWQLLASLQARFEKDRLSAAQAQASNRGYDRIVRHAEYLVFGAGEGALYRFQSRSTLEVHSSLGTLLFSYGVVGLLLFLRMLWLVARNGGAMSLLYLAPAMCYSLAHNGLRQTEFWILIVMAASLQPRHLRRAQSARGPLRYHVVR